MIIYITLMLVSLSNTRDAFYDNDTDDLGIDSLGLDDLDLDDYY